MSGILYNKLTLRQILKNCRGFVLIDALIGMVILATALTALTVAYTQTTNQTTVTNDKMYATHLAKQTIEQLKSNDRVRQTTIDVKNALQIPAEKSYEDEHGVVYTVKVVSESSEFLGSVKDVITPLKVKVTWKDQAITMFSYYYNQPVVSVTSNNDPPSMYNAIYGGHDDAMNRRNPVTSGVVNRSGYFYTSLSREYQLWSQLYGEKFSYNPDTLKNVAITNNWGSGGDMLQFDNILFTGNTDNSTQWDEFSFLVRNDVRSWADTLTDGRYSQQWTLPPNYNHFKFNFYIKYLGEKASESPENIQKDSYLLIKDLLVKASNDQFYGPTANSGTKVYHDKDEKIVDYWKSGAQEGVKAISGKPRITVVVKDGYIQLKNIPKGYYSIGLQWTNDECWGLNDANALISNLSIKKGPQD